jgi:DNA polymerase
MLPPTLPHLAEQIRACQRCPLGRLRTQAVPGEGRADAELMFIGEGPGFHEDRQGRPFVGNSGQMLDELLQGIGLARQDCFITNVIKCRPPENRDPLPQEIEACKPYLEQQIALVDPLLIVTLGRYSMAHFFAANARITHIHGQPLRLERAIVLPLYHPAAVLRNPGWRQDLAADFATIPALLAEARQLRQPPPPPPPAFEQLTLL